MAPAENGRDRREFERESAERWGAAIRELLSASPPKSARWDSVPSILGVLNRLTDTFNHMFFPSRGGNDLGYVEAGNEPNSVILGVTGGTAFLGKPRSLTFELMEQDWAQSFFVLDLYEIAPSGVYYDQDDGEGDEDEAVFADTPVLAEELVEIAPGCYEPRAVWDRGFTGYDDYGQEVPLPPGSRLVKRMLSGRVLIVSKASHWNREGRTYDARHNRMSNDAIRVAIDRLTGALR